MNKFAKFTVLCAVVLLGFVASATVMVDTARVIHVATAETGGSDKHGDGTPDKPYATISQALSVADAGDRIMIGAGTYLQTAGLTLDNGVQLRGATGNPADVIIKVSGNGSLYLLTVNHLDSQVCDLTLDGGREPNSGGYRTPVCFDAGGGTVTNCVIRNGFLNTWETHAAGVMLSDASTLTHSVVSNCYVQTSFRSCGVLWGNGKVSNCLIVDNRSDRDISPIVNLTGNGKLENCTVVRNEAHGSTCQHLIAEPSAKVANCVLACNTLNGEPAQVAAANAAVFAGCASDTAALGADGVISTAVELFKDPAHGNWEPRAGSPLVNGGVEPSVAVASDLLGRPRVANGAIDIGAYELDLSVFDFSLAADRSEGPVPADYTFTASVTGCDAGDAMSYQWDFDGDGKTDRTTTVPTVVWRYESAGYQSVTLTVVNETKQFSKTLTFANQLLLLPQQILVAAGNENAAYPYATWATAAADIQTAIDTAVDGCEVVVSNGTYSLTGATAPIRLEKPIVVRSLTGKPEDVRITGGTDNGSYRLLFINNLRARLSGVALDSGREPIVAYRTLVYFDAGGGTVSNCVIRNGFHNAWETHAAGVMLSDASTLTHSVVSNCYVQTSYQACGVLWGSGKVSNCLIVGNRSDRDISPIVNLTGSGSMENCTVVSNDVRGTALHLGVSESARVRNSIFAANVREDQPCLAFTDIPSCFSRCLADLDRMGAAGDGLMASSSAIFNDARRPWHVKPGSPAHDVIPAAQAGELPSVDLGGRARLVGGKLDLGCYECQSRGLLLMVR